MPKPGGAARGPIKREGRGGKPRPGVGPGRGRLPTDRRGSAQKPPAASENRAVGAGGKGLRLGAVDGQKGRDAGVKARRLARRVLLHRGNAPQVLLCGPWPFLGLGRPGAGPSAASRTGRPPITTALPTRARPRARGDELARAHGRDRAQTIGGQARLLDPIFRPSQRDRSRKRRFAYHKRVVRNPMSETSEGWRIAGAMSVVIAVYVLVVAGVATALGWALIR